MQMFRLLRDILVVAMAIACTPLQTFSYVPKTTVVGLSVTAAAAVALVILLIMV